MDSPCGLLTPSKSACGALSDEPLSIDGEFDNKRKLLLVESTKQGLPFILLVP